MSKEVFGRAHDYREQVERSIAFVGQKMDYFTDAKANILLKVAEKHLGLTPRLTALDIGCGVGLTDQRLVDQLGSLHGVDVSEEALKCAAETNPQARYQSYDGEILPFPDDQFDLVFAINVLHHVPPKSWQQFAAEMNRVTKSGGIAAIFEHNPLNPLTRLAVRRCEFDEGASLVWHGKSKRLLTNAGLRVIESSYIIFFPFPNPLLARLEYTLRRLPLGAQHFVVGRKG